MKKNKKIKISAAILLPVIATCVVAGVGYDHYNKYMKPEDSKISTDDDFDINKPIEDRIDEEKSQETKKELDKIKETHQKAEDVVIPDDATEKEKEQLGIAKQYLTIFDSVNKIYQNALEKNGLDNDKFAMAEIVDVYRTSGAYIFNLDVIKENNGKYFHSNVLFKITSSNAETIDDLVSNMEDFTAGEIKYEFDAYLSNREMNMKLLYDTDPGENREILFDSVLFTSGDLNETPQQSNILVSDGENYTIINLNYWGHSIGKTYQEMQNEIMTQQSYAQKSILNSYIKSSIDWKSFLNEYKEYQRSQQEAQAQAIINNFSTFDENGKIDGFDWNAYQESNEQKEAEKEAKELEQNITQQARVTYTEQELGF